MTLRKTGRLAFLIVLVTLLGIPSTGLAKSSDSKLNEVKQEARELINALKDYTSDQRKDATQKIKTALNNLDNRIEALEKRMDKKWDGMKKSTREQVSANLKALRKQRARVAKEYDRLKNSSVDAWQHMKKGFSKAFADLNTAWEKVENEFE